MLQIIILDTHRCQNFGTSYCITVVRTKLHSLATRTHIDVLVKPEGLVIWRRWGERTAGTEFHLWTQAGSHHLPLFPSGNTETDTETRYLEIIAFISNIRKRGPKSTLELQFCTTVEETR
jgi:hypothetical protein